jgi:hypothetical protein
MRTLLPALAIGLAPIVGAGPPRPPDSRPTPSRLCPHSPVRAAPLAPALADSGRIFRGAIAPGGRELYYFRKVTDDPREEDYRIFVSRLTDGAWSPGERVTLGGEYSDLYPVVSPDGRRLVFTSYRPIPGDSSTHASAGLWYAERGDDGAATGWGRPVPVRGATEPGSYHSQPVFLGDRLVFRRTSADWKTTHTLVSRWEGDDYGPAAPYRPAERWMGWRKDLYVWGGSPTADERAVLFEISPIDRATGRRQPADLWASVRRGDRWTEPRPLGAGVNAAGRMDNFPVASADGCDLVYVRDFTAFYRVSLRRALTASD